MNYLNIDSTARQATNSNYWNCEQLAQVAKQAEILGYKAGDRLYIRCIAGKGFDVKADKLYPFDGYLTVGTWEFTRLEPQSKGGAVRYVKVDGLSYLKAQNDQGYGVYLVVNPGGRKDDEITKCFTLFYECDNITIDEQWNKVNELIRLGLTPSLIIQTRNSLHVYITLDLPITEGSQWQRLQQRLIQLMESDKSIHNPSRLMRLAGFKHQKIGCEPVPVTIQVVNDVTYSLEEIEAALPPWDENQWTDGEINNEDWQARAEEIKARRKIIVPSSEAFPLEICLSKQDRDLIDYGAVEGERYAQGFKLACNLIGTEKFLQAAGYRFTGTAEELFTLFSLNSNAQSNRDPKRAWRDANRVNCTPTLSFDAMENCINSWRRKNGHEVEETITGDRQTTTKKKPTRPRSPKGYANLQRTGDHIGDMSSVDWLLDYGEGNINVNISPPGSGKSYENAKLNLAVKRKAANARAVLAVPDSRNPTVDLDGYDILWPRNRWGFYRDDDGKLVRAEIDTPPEKIEFRNGNCIKTEIFETLANASIDAYGNSKEPLPCIGCENKSSCMGTEGGFRYDRRKVLSSGNSFVCHPSSLIGVNLEEDGFPTALFIDEWSKQLNSHFDYKVKLPDADVEIEDCIVELTELQKIKAKEKEGSATPIDEGEEESKPIDYDARFSPARKVIRQFKAIAKSEEANKGYGLENADILKQLELTEQDLTGLKTILADIETIKFNPFELLEVADTPKTSTFIEQLERTERITEKINSKAPSVLAFILKAVLGDTRQYLHLKGDRLSVKVFNPDRYKFIDTARWAMLADATGNVNDLPLKLNTDKPIVTIWKGDGQPLRNLTYRIVEMSGLGRRGERSKLCQERVTGLINAIADQHNTVPTVFCLKVDRKGHSPTGWIDADGHWGNETRGSNDFKGSEVIISVGEPVANIGAKNAEYFTMYGTLDGVEEWRRRCTNEEIRQAERSRCHLYPDKHFYHYHIAPPGADYEFLKQDGATVEFIEPTQITPTAGDRQQRLKDKYENVIKQLLNENRRVTCKAIGEEVGVSRQAVSKYLKNAGIALPDWVSSLKVTCQPSPKQITKDKVDKIDKNLPSSTAYQTTKEGAAIAIDDGSLFDGWTEGQEIWLWWDAERSWLPGVIADTSRASEGHILAVAGDRQLEVNKWRLDWLQVREAAIA